MIGGNISVTLQERSEGTKNTIGEQTPSWSNLAVLTGWLDLSSGDSKYTTYDAKLQESTHVFICDYVSVDKKPSDKRLVVDGDVYDVLLIDDPMNLHQQLEIYLKYVGR